MVAAMNTKVCTTCKECLPEQEFGLTMHRGRPYRLPECKECRRERDRRMYENRMRKEPKPRVIDPLNLLLNRWRGRVNRKEPLRWAK